MRNSIFARSETVKYMMEFIVYSSCVPWAAKSSDPQVKFLLKWQIERAIKLCRDSGVKADSLILLRTTPDAEKLRQYMRDYYGTAWTLRALGF